LRGNYFSATLLLDLVSTETTCRRITVSEFTDKVVVITGGGGGIGRAAAARFLAEGASVVLSSRRR
jgi:FlaA1/EpsC-like NDP-sugar epimerase